jgi:hypothetical protein
MADLICIKSIKTMFSDLLPQKATAKKIHKYNRKIQTTAFCEYALK